MAKRLGVAVWFVLVAAACGYNPGPYTPPGDPDGAAGNPGDVHAVDVGIADTAADARGLLDASITSHDGSEAAGRRDGPANDAADLPLAPDDGATSGTGGAGGTRGTGGQSGTGGAVMGGGGVGTGGGSVVGGTTGVGGGAGTGGRSVGTGGGPGTGGTLVGAGGRPGTGGMIPGTGGTPGTGGAPSTGGTTGSSSGRSAGCGQAPTIPSSQYNNGTTIPITAAGLARRYILNVPTNYDNTKAYRLVLAFHQLDGNDKFIYSTGYYHLLPLANDSAIFVAPNGQYQGAGCTGTGSGEGGCGWPNSSDTDLALVDAIVAQLEQSFCIDTQRIFATGWNYGGSMSYRIACSRPQNGPASWSVRGIAVYSGAQLSGTCTPTKSVAYYTSHGTADTVLPDFTFGLPLFQNFAAANGCTYVTPTWVTSGDHQCTTLTGCKAGYPTEFCSFNGQHTPDPKDPGQTTSWEYQTVWNFLSQL